MQTITKESESKSLLVNKEAARKLEIRNLQKSTKTALVMDEINITIFAGEIFALVGRPASCKSLLSKMIVSLVKKTAGEVIIDEAKNTKFTLSAKKIGASLEAQNFYPDQTAYKVLERYAILNYHPLSRSRIVNILNLVNLKKVMHHTLDSFSKSALARLKIALAIYGCPDVLVIDDPFRDLSPIEARNIRIIIKTIAEIKQTAVLLTAQNITDVEEICDTIGIIDDGFMVTTKSYNQFIRDDAPHTKVRVQTETPNYAAKIIEEKFKYKTFLCGEWVIVETPPSNAQAIANALVTRDVKVLSMQRVNRSLSEQFFEIISLRHRLPGLRAGGAS